MTERKAPAQRPDVVVAELPPFDARVLERPLPAWRRALDNEAARKIVIALALLAAWEIYARYVDDALMFPGAIATARALADGIARGALLDRVATSLELLLVAYAIGVAGAALFTALAVTSRLWSDVLSMLATMFNPLPAIALLPLALLWFGLGARSIALVVVHSVLWPVALSTHAGFRAVSESLRMVGRNVGLTGLRFVVVVLVPAAFPSILTGLKVGWAFAWRTLIAAELVFGVSSRSGGIGWFIFEKKNQLETASVFAGLATVVVIGLFVENVVFRAIEARTVRRWGMLR